MDVICAGEIAPMILWVAKKKWGQQALSKGAVASGYGDAGACVRSSLSSLLAVDAQLGACPVNDGQGMCIPWAT